MATTTRNPQAASHPRAVNKSSHKHKPSGRAPPAAPALHKTTGTKGRRDEGGTPRSQCLPITASNPPTRSSLMHRGTHRQRRRRASTCSAHRHAHRAAEARLLSAPGTWHGSKRRPGQTNGLYFHRKGAVDSRRPGPEGRRPDARRTHRSASCDLRAAAPRSPSRQDADRPSLSAGGVCVAGAARLRVTAVDTGTASRDQTPCRRHGLSPASPRRSWAAAPWGPGTWSGAVHCAAPARR